MTYKLTNDGSGGVLVVDENGDMVRSIPSDPSNTDFAEFLAWCEKGNKPLEADPLPLPLARDVDSFDKVTRERLLAFKAMTPQQVGAWIDANVVEISPSAKAAIRDLAVSVSILYRANSGDASL